MCLYTHILLVFTCSSSFFLLLLFPSHDANGAQARNRTPISTASIDSVRKKEKRETENRIFSFSLDTIGRTQHIRARKTTLILDAKEKREREEKEQQAILPSILTRELDQRMVVACQWRWKNESIRKNTKYMVLYTNVGIRCAFCYHHLLFSTNDDAKSLYFRKKK